MFDVERQRLADETVVLGTLKRELALGCELSGIGASKPYTAKNEYYIDQLVWKACFFKVKPSWALDITKCWMSVEKMYVTSLCLSASRG